MQISTSGPRNREQAAYFISLMYFARSLISAGDSVSSNGGIWFLPLAITFASAEDGILIIAGFLKLLTPSVFPRSDPRPEGPWHPSQFALYRSCGFSAAKVEIANNTAIGRNLTWILTREDFFSSKCLTITQCKHNQLRFDTSAPARKISHVVKIQLPALAAEPTTLVQNAQRLAAIGISLRHSGHFFVVGSAGATPRFLRSV